MSNPLVWYVSYGTNMLRRRFMLYITGGHLKEFARDHRGCPDATPPRKDVAMEIPGELFFASYADHWQGMVAAFIDTGAKSERTKVRAYLITLDQLEHILGQECNIETSIPINLPTLRAQGQMVVGKGSNFFNQLVYLGDMEGYPLITFTNSGEDLVYNAPGDAYMNVLVQGAMQTHRLTEQEARSYFMSRKRREANIVSES